MSWINNGVLIFFKIIIKLINILIKLSYNKLLLIKFRDLERALNRLAIRRQVENQISEKRRSKALTYKEKIKNDEYDNYNVPRKVERLRIIKPMAGSQVMQQWRQMTQVDLDTAVSQELTHI